MSRKDIVTGTFRDSPPPPPTAGSAPGIPSPKCIDREGLAGEKMSCRQTFEHWREQETVSLYYTYVYSKKPKPFKLCS